MAIHQISVFLENRAGQLAEITALLAKNNIDLRAINIAETSDYGVLRLIASHEPEACRVLRENGFIFSASEVVAVGAGKLNDKGERIVPDVKVGDQVYYGKFGGNEVKVDGEDFLLLRADDIYAIITE